MSGSEMPGAKPIPERRVKALRTRTVDCAVACRAVLASQASKEVKRAALGGIVRYATKVGIRRPGDLQSVGAAAFDEISLKRAGVHREHVVPVRVLVGRMVDNGDDPLAVLNVAVVAHVLREEHRQLGTLKNHHPELWAEMQRAPLDSLPGLGRKRYESSGVTLTQVR